MYATKPLSLFKGQPEAASRPPPEGGSSGYLVVKGPDDDGGDDETRWWGACGGTRVWELPFPQNRVLTVRDDEQYDDGNPYSDAVVFVPVPDVPLAANRYYPVVATGKHKGLVRACSREEDKGAFCSWRFVRDVKPRPFDPADVYQQIEIVQHRRGRFTAKAVAADGFPYLLYGKKYWHVYASKPKKIDLGFGEARGLDAALRSRQLPDAGVVGAFPAPISAVVGKWFCPFFLVREAGVAPREQMERSAFYAVELEQHWEPVRAHGGSKLPSKKAFIGGGVEAAQEAQTSRAGDAYVWFRAAASGQRIGLCSSVWERMRWEEYRGGWVDEEEDAGKVPAGGSVLVERFVVKRMDGTVALAVDFAHLNKVRASPDL